MEQKQEFKKDLKEEKLIRILATDIPGNIKLYPGLTRIKGISWTFSNAICKKLKLNKDKRIGELSQEEIQVISNFIKNPEVPIFIVNRRKDFASGENKHLVMNDLDLEKEFDVKRLRKIKSYRGIRHGVGLPVRGQRTKAHFRRNRRKSTGVKGKKK